MFLNLLQSSPYYWYDIAWMPSTPFAPIPTPSFQLPTSSSSGLPICAIGDRIGCHDDWYRASICAVHLA
ncbi:hypothetical protein CY34DRAFT_18609 [Suillus luteus UH-Slu-Lm8-n1]|uniref:Uncharacterized protein n=1 Tax=Suillus luteus UH-Slu-Lm8-n1 TaxID=930992 RepID=A0A0D0A4C5_9AGAM|nr:hypothetical protein CY34DRAFT_18609 [Suillus luteus UH-Slu-Lm8-n1]